jgi:pimeloyl-ACP methyl ester carboxylesterase
VILDYIRHFGEDALSGLHFVGGVTKLGTSDAMSVISTEFLDLTPGLFSSQAEDSVQALESLLRLCYGPSLSTDELYLRLGYNAAVPPHVRRALFSRSIDNDDLLSRIRKPVLITHATEDGIVRPSAVDQVRTRVAHAEVHLLSTTVHACFWSNAEEFNLRLQTFAERCRANTEIQTPG